MIQLSTITGEVAKKRSVAFLATSPPKPLIVLLGPTASGKTDFSIRLATVLNTAGTIVEIINADSRQFYKYLDIGTAKITKEEMQNIPHHLLSVLDPKEPCTIAWFQKEATKKIVEIHTRGSVPLLVGGSMLYITALIDGFQPLASDPEIRERLNREYDQDSGESLMQQLKELDPSSAVGIPVQNKVYLVRALEIALSTGKSKSSQQVKSGSSYDLLLFGMSVDTETLKVRIEKRINTMLESGWVHEVKRLRELGYSASDPAMESHGYREIMASLAEGKIDTKSLTEGIARKSIRYTKRSMTWWKRDPRVQWVKI